MATQRSSLFNMFYSGGFGITLLMGPNFFFGAKGIAPYFLIAPTSWSEVSAYFTISTDVRKSLILHCIPYISGLGEALAQC